VERLGQRTETSFVIGPLIADPLSCPFGVIMQPPLSSQKTETPLYLLHIFLCLRRTAGMTKVKQDIRTLLLEFWLSLSYGDEHEITDRCSWESVEHATNEVNGDNVQDLCSRVINTWNLGTDWDTS